MPQIQTHQIQVWLALPAKRCDDNLIGDLRLEMNVAKPPAPIRLTVRLPEGNGSFPCQLPFYGLDSYHLLTRIAHVVRIVDTIAVRLAEPPVCPVHSRRCDRHGITLTVSEVDGVKVRELAQLTVASMASGLPFRYRATWADAERSFVDKITIELQSHDVRPWGLLGVVGSTLAAIKDHPHLAAMQYARALVPEPRESAKPW